MGIRYHQDRKKSSLKKKSSYLFYQKKKEFLYWFVLGCLLSLFIHFFLIKKIRTFQISSFNPASFDKFIPRKFCLERVEIDPRSLEEPKSVSELLLKPVEVIIPEKKDTTSQEISSGETLTQSKPNTDNISALEEKTTEELSEKNMLSQAPQQAKEPIISLDKEELEQKNSLENSPIPSSSTTQSYSQLDDLIKEKEPLSSQTAPILLPTDLLFEYNADQLKLEGEKSLQKLALLIQRNPKAFFIIEGFTDSFGTAEYNLDLSTRRANSIKEWLIKKQSVDPHQIEAYGLGKTHFLVPSTGTIQQQQLNRRVEIVIRKM